MLGNFTLFALIFTKSVPRVAIYDAAAHICASLYYYPTGITTRRRRHSRCEQGGKMKIEKFIRLQTIFFSLSRCFIFTFLYYICESNEWWKKRGAGGIKKKKLSLISASCGMRVSLLLLGQIERRPLAPLFSLSLSFTNIYIWNCVLLLY